MRILLVVCLALICIACDDSPEQPNNALQISGTTAMGSLQLGTVTVYDYSSCVKGEVLATTQLQDTNAFNFNIASGGVNRPVLIELSNFSYQEEWSDTVVFSFDKILYSAVVLPVSTAKNVVVSFWTNLAFALSSQKCSLGTEKAIDIITDSNEMFSTALTFDINQDTPILINNFSSPDFTVKEFANMSHGVANASIASYTYYLDSKNGDDTYHKVYNSIEFAALAFDDLSFEGLLNGVSAQGPLEYGGEALSMETYRTDLPNQMDAIIANLTDLPAGIDNSFLQSLANKLHTENMEIFSFTQAGIDLGDTTAPILVGKTLTACGAGPVGTSGSETVYRNIVTVTYDVLDYDSSYTVTAPNQAGVTIEVLENGTVPWLSGQKPAIQYTLDSLHLRIPPTTAVFTNRFGEALSVTTGMTTQPCGMF